MNADRASLMHYARVLIAQSRATRHRDWSFALLTMAARARRRAMGASVAGQGGQMGLFA